MAHKKAGGSANTNRDSISKRLGLKKFGGETVGIGNIILRQKGSKFNAGIGVKKGNDYTLFAVVAGIVQYKTKLGKRVVDILPSKAS